MSNWADNLTELTLSDFDSLMATQQTNDLPTFVNTFLPKEALLEFPSRLSRLVLPNVSHGDSAIAESMKLLLDKLRNDFRIQQIVRLIGKDNTGQIDDDLMAEWVHKFKVERLDWHKRDFDISFLQEFALQKHGHRLALRVLSLYTAGHWGVIYHWLSPDGLFSIPGVSKVSLCRHYRHRFELFEPG
jgi:hypothetical protein